MARFAPLGQHEVPAPIFGAREPYAIEGGISAGASLSRLSRL
jgi:hypothetical protein